MQDAGYGLPRSHHKRSSEKSTSETVWKIVRGASGAYLSPRCGGKEASLSLLSIHGSASIGANRNFQTVFLGSRVNKEPQSYHKGEWRGLLVDHHRRMRW